MQRRNFLKYLLAFSACSTCACIRENKTSKLTFKDNQETFQIKIPICYHCNLNCAYCSHFSPIAPKYEVPINVFERDIMQLKKVANDKVSRISLLGGEPLLHKDIEKLIEILSYYFPKNSKRITTNGLLLKEMPESFWKTCKKHNIIFKYTPYILQKNYKQEEEIIQNLSKKYEIEIKKYDEKIDNFELINLSKKITKADYNKYDTCEKKYSCPLLDDGILYPCEVIGSARFFNNHFKDKAIPITKNDYLDIRKISSVKEIYEFFNTPKDFCKYCGFGHNVKTKPWQISKKELSEWYDIKKG